MKLILGSTYLLYTRNMSSDNTKSFYAGIKVSVDSLLTYSEVKKLYQNDLNSTIDTHNITEDDQADFGNKQFYKCSFLKDSTKDKTVQQYTKKIYIVWDDIIDELMTTRLDATFSCSLNFKINNSENPITENELNQLISEFVSTNINKFTTKSKYGDGSKTFVAEVSDPESDIYKQVDDLEAKLSQAERTIDTLNLLTTSSEKVVKDLNTLNTGKVIEDISTKVDSISEKVDIIESNLS